MERTITTNDGFRVDIARPRSRIGALVRAIVTAMKIRAMRRRLEALPDHLLKDVGISRSGIETAIRYGRCRSECISAADDHKTNTGKLE